MELTCASHSYHDVEELCSLRTNLLGWYDKSKRDLPWRTLALTEKDVNIRAYGVWVSEIMLQQTQVVTVKDYYIRWMQKWPTVEDLASATLEEVHAAWAGLGYYSRGERLLEGAKKVVLEMGGVIPDTTQELVKHLSGVGRYTAGAIVSIAFNKVASIVDGNVARVFSRHRVIGGQSSSQAVTKHLWKLAELCVDHGRPGDFNQALMELGATICTPKAPHCQDCPIMSSCLSFKREQDVDAKPTSTTSSDDISPNPCQLCLHDWKEELGVMNYPPKVKKKSSPTEEFSVAVIEDQQGLFLLQKRPPTGLLAGLWEFPAVMVTGDSSHDQMWKKFQGRHIGTVSHHFSHIHHLYHCWHMPLSSDQDKSTLPLLLSSPPTQGEALKWVSRNDIRQTGVPASVKKIIKLLDLEGTEQKVAKKRSNQNPTSFEECTKRQKTLSCFFRKDKSHMTESQESQDQNTRVTGVT